MPPVQTRQPSSVPGSPDPTGRPRTSISSQSIAGSSGPYTRPPAPYMVALSGWPEPVYISHRSRPSSPKPFFSGENSDGIETPSHQHRSGLNSPAEIQVKPEATRKRSPVPAESIFSKQCMYNNAYGAGCPIPDHPNHVARYAASSHKHRMKSEHGGDSPFPTSSARTPTHSPPPPSRPASSSNSNTPFNGTSSRYSTFRDPRFAPNAGVLNSRNPLRVAPSWSSSAPSSTPMPNVGVTVAAGERGMGILVMRSTPDVYPPPRMVGLPGMTGMTDMLGSTQKEGGRGFGLATEVYPRDPDSAFLWGSTSGVGKRQEEGEPMDIDRERRGGW